MYKFFTHQNSLKVGFRIGFGVGYLCKQFFPKAMGIMITASHNPMKDNGIKIMDIDGGMLRMSLEKYFNLIVNEPNLKKAIDIFQTNIKKFFNNPPNDK